ncbi:MAG: hypothetical protein A2Y45_04590 [Tenericutes bacterium GWC2_34_14]|nr:MAG: hypothetical protein A2Y45_04590 [Tenericutes bacterium GWC2_34_14]OHE34037.1 MAG: hypothetical protein A2012_05245 [Tenericutes bacterium GWE2_34_108]OHE35366.1 MAG: hypothetical protein A2Y46_04590 [Tenericutes bacterium GWF1_35_14]OHE38487.1 MAG: hypothetical protein A2Y44_08155 [Tenericutes bacterium GWF2_35_184]OHE43129.1 MAG: hypothetical protein A2221_05725 [Tenericutes bacterium RIFOXYA2_FULL_36_32]OHE45547.1 MAG: hypothetical protein A3K26_03660 [Tenericutes bacterium RIFOXYA1
MTFQIKVINAYCANNPVIHIDSTGYWFGFGDIFTGPIDEILVLELLALVAAVGISGASAEAYNGYYN